MPASFAADSQLSHLLKSIPASGQVDVATALSAFTAAVGPIAGVPKEPGVATPIESGSIAIDWILADWALLTPTQQQAVEADLAGTETASAGAHPSVNVASVRRTIGNQVHAGSPNADCQTTDSAGATAYRSQVLAIEQDLASHSGIDFPDPIVLVVNTKNVDTSGIKSLMYTYGCAGTSIDIGGPSSVTSCAVHIQPRITSTTGGYAYSSSDIHSSLIHELTHCLMIEHWGIAESHMPAWFSEGFATWAQNVLGGGDVVSTDYWLQYLETPDKPLSKRDYDGIGFFTHLAETGTSPWAQLGTIGDTLAADGDSSVDGFAAADPTATFTENWGSGFSEGRYAGTPWKSSGPNLPTYPADLGDSESVKDGATLTVTSEALATALQPLDVDAQVVEVSPGDGSFGRISTGHGGDSTLAAAANENFCADSGGCICPTSSDNAGATFTPMTDGAEYLGVSGGAVKGSVIVTGESLSTFCNTAKACMIGTWKTTNATSTVAPSINGGANVIWTITDRGLVSLDYDNSTPLVNPDLPAALGTITTRGTQVGQITLPSANATSGPWADTTVSDNLTVDGEPENDGIGDSGSWTCSDDAMTITLSGDGGAAVISLARESH